MFDGVRLTHLLEVIENGGKVKIENQKVKIKIAHGTSSVTEDRSSTHSSPQNHNTMINHEEDSEDCNSKIPKSKTTHEKKCTGL